MAKAKRVKIKWLKIIDYKITYKVNEGTERHPFYVINIDEVSSIEYHCDNLMPAYHIVMKNGESYKITDDRNFEYIKKIIELDL